MKLSHLNREEPDSSFAFVRTRHKMRTWSCNIVDAVYP